MLDTEVDFKQEEHRTGTYIWNVGRPHSETRLHLVREHRFEGFDHLRDCKQ